MILSRTPIRITFTGGGTDIREYYSKNGGAVVNSAIDKYIYIGVNRRFEDNIRVSYSTTEITTDVNEIKHGPVRESLKFLNIGKGTEITSLADIPGRGTGLGSSSCFTVGILNSLHAFKNQKASQEQLAQEACRIEREILREPGGKQDQYIAAYGGLRFIEFLPDETVSVNEIKCSAQDKKELNRNLMMMYIGFERQADKIQTEMKKTAVNRAEILDRMRQMAFETRDAVESGDIDRIGKLLHEGWEQKKRLAGGISNPQIDAYYEKARSAGAIGGKVMGSGGGGFFLFYCPLEKQEDVKKALPGLKYTPFSFEAEGSRIIYSS